MSACACAFCMCARLCVVWAPPSFVWLGLLVVYHGCGRLEVFAARDAVMLSKARHVLIMSGPAITQQPGYESVRKT